MLQRLARSWGTATPRSRRACRARCSRSASISTLVFGLAAISDRLAPLPAGGRIRAALGDVCGDVSAVVFADALDPAERPAIPRREAAWRRRRFAEITCPPTHSDHELGRSLIGSAPDARPRGSAPRLRDLEAPLAHPPGCAPRSCQLAGTDRTRRDRDRLRAGDATPDRDPPHAARAPGGRRGAGGSVRPAAGGDRELRRPARPQRSAGRRLARPAARAPCGSAWSTIPKADSPTCSRLPEREAPRLRAALRGYRGVELRDAEEVLAARTAMRREKVETVRAELVLVAAERRAARPALPRPRPAGAFRGGARRASSAREVRPSRSASTCSRRAVVAVPACAGGFAARSPPPSRGRARLRGACCPASAPAAGARDPPSWPSGETSTRASTSSCARGRPSSRRRSSSVSGRPSGTGEERDGQSARRLRAARRSQLAASRRAGDPRPRLPRLRPPLASRAL